jgi:uncharacterized membrane protein YeaQ/YmgE (transglycosylase-associated protein family)
VAAGTSSRHQHYEVLEEDSLDLLWFIIIGALAGFLAGRFMKGNGFGLIGDLIVGVIGSFLGAYLLRKAGVEIGHGLLGSVLVAFIGAVVLLFIVRLFTSNHGGYRRGGHRRLWS